MNAQTPQEYYASQSRITDPGQYAHLYEEVPADIEGVGKVVRGLVLHYFGDKWQYNYPPERMAEIDTRYVPAMIHRLMEMDARAISEPRTPDTRIVGCCRDFTALAVSMLRYAGIPARSRHGFANYFEEGYNIDHVVVEFWNGKAWQLFDSEIDQQYFNFNVQDVPRDRFIVGGQAWQMCRAGKADPDLFGLGSVAPLKGWSFIRTRLLEDLAALNKIELLCWDTWAYDGEQEQLSADDLALLDHVAEVTQQGDDGFDEVRRLFNEDQRLRLPEKFNSFSPAHKPEELPIVMSLA